MANNNPKVSVCVVTYNQENYIRQCLQSIVDQVTDFDFEVIVADDGSTDRTRAIVQEFVDRFPGLVKAIFHKTNIGPYKNFIFVHQQAMGEYIAHVDGDDYCLPGKLQVQADLLDSDPSCNIVFHKMLVEISGEIYEGSLQGIDNIERLRLDRGALIQYMAMAGNSSKMYRKDVRDFELPDFDVTDYFANVMQIGDGVARFVGDQNYGVYRVGVGIASEGSRTRHLLCNSFEYFYKLFPSCRLEVNTAALICLLGDAINKRKTWPMFFVIWLRTFHAGSVINLLRNLKFLKKIKLPKEMIKANLPVPTTMPVDREEWGRQLNLSNFINSYYQYRDIQLLKGCRRLLIVGPGQGLDTAILKWRGYEVQTFDIDETFNPDFIGSVHDLSTFSDQQFDAVIVSHVLEHLAEPYLDVALREISRVGKNALIYLPVHGKHLQIKLSLGSRAFYWTFDLFNYFHKPSGVTARYMEGQHFWEIGMRGYRVSELTKRLAKNFRIIKSYRNDDWMPSYNFVLESIGRHG